MTQTESVRRTGVEAQRGLKIMRKIIHNIKNLILKATSDVKYKGEYTLTFADITSHPDGPKLERKVVEAAKQGWTEYRKALDNLHAKCATRKIVIENLVVNDGLNVIARILAGDTTYTGKITHCALGTGTAPVAAGDTALGTEVFRRAVTSNVFSANQSFISTFFLAADDADTYNEVGHYIDGDASVDSGQLYSRIEEASTSEITVTKTLTDTLTVDYKVTQSNA